MSSEQKQDVISKVEEVSQNDAARALAEMLPEAQPTTERRRAKKNGLIDITLTVDQEFIQKYERVDELNSHKNLDMRGVFEMLLEEHIERNAPEHKKPRTTTQSHTAAESAPGRRIYLTVETIRRLHVRAGSQCEHVNDKGQRCPRRHHLQVDHKISLADGGTNEFSNLQLYCRPHNLNKGSRSEVRSPRLEYRAPA
jgi:5-methylcytosine-specific restriction endonuclease McrA